MVGGLVWVASGPQRLQVILVFPLGILEFFPATLLPRNKSASHVLFIAVVLAVYAIYLILIAEILRARRWNTMWILCLLLAGLFVLNLAGCHKMLENFHKFGEASPKNLPGRVEKS